MPNPNKQDGNVGNLGDVLKHVALLRLLREACRYDSTLYVETHAYEPFPRLAAPNWGSLVDDLPASTWAADYHRLQKPWVDDGHYLASTGIASVVLDPRRAAFVLCESNPGTRSRLRHHLPAASVLEDACRLPEALVCASRLRSVVALIDPFSLVTAEAVRWIRAVAEAGHEADFVATLVFTFGSRPEWNSLGGVLPLVASISRPPFQLALFMKMKLAGVDGEILVRDLVELGWSRAAEPAGMTGDEPPPTGPPPPPADSPVAALPSALATFRASLQKLPTRQRLRQLVEALEARRIAIAGPLFWEVAGTAVNSWGDLTNCGAEDTAQAHVLGKGGTPTNPQGRRSSSVLRMVRDLCESGRRATTYQELERLWA